MTFCLALSIRDFSLVVSDTRVNLVVNGEDVVHDGPADLDISVKSPQYSLHVPFRQRKITRVGRGWLAMAGHYLLANELLTQSVNHSSDQYQDLEPVLRSSIDKATARIHETTELQLEDFENTVIFGAPFEGEHVWVFSCNEKIVRSTSDAGNFVINWPDDFDSQHREAEQLKFIDALEHAQQRGSLPDVFRAVAHLVRVSALGSDKSGMYCQIGLSLKSTADRVESMYFQDHCDNILRMPDGDIIAALDSID